MNDHRYILEPYKGMNSRYHCPSSSCNARDKTFVRYIDTETGEYLDESVGKCNRESKCGYHYSPKQYFQDHNVSFAKLPPRPSNMQKGISTPPKPVSFISAEVFKASLKGHTSNHFVTILINLFGVEVTGGLISKYFIGTSKHWSGSVVFWQIDQQGKIRTGKIMLYDAIARKRVKVPFDHITWAHTILKLPDFGLKQCFFGEHLLQDGTKPVAIVESEKTAVIASVYLPQFIWLAAGSLDGLNFIKCQVLKGRSVTLFPDINGFDKWLKKAKELSQIALVNVSDLLERMATEEERTGKLDLADYLMRYDPSEFTIPETTAENPDKSVIDQNQEPELKYQTLGEIFDMINAGGYKTLAKRIQIN